MKTISLEDLKLIQGEFGYEKDTGRLTRKKKKGVRSEEVHGAKDRNGYRTVSVTVGGRHFMIKKHRLCWMLATGEVPSMVKFVDGNLENFVFSNLAAYEAVTYENRVRPQPEKGPDYSAIYATAEQWKKWEQEEKARLEEERQADLEELERLNSMNES